MRTWYHLPMTYKTVYNLSFDSVCFILTAESNFMFTLNWLCHSLIISMHIIPMRQILYNVEHKFQCNSNVAFKRVDCPLIMCPTCFSRTFIIYKYQTTPFTAFRRQQPSLSSRRTFGAEPPLWFPRRKIYTNIYDLVLTYFIYIYIYIYIYIWYWCIN